MTGGPPVRGTKLTAWRIPPVWENLQGSNVPLVPEGSTVPNKQKRLLGMTREVLTAIAADVRAGLLETVGVDSSLSMDDDRCSVLLVLPAGADAELIARAIDAENVEAWPDSEGRVHVGINPWYSTKDVDQTVLSAIKVIHVLLGIHATDSLSETPKTVVQKLMASVSEIMLIQKKAVKKTE